MPNEIAQLPRAERFEGAEHSLAVREELLAAVERHAKLKGARSWEARYETVTKARCDNGYSVEHHPVGYFVVVAFDGNVPELRTAVHETLVDALWAMLSWVEG